MKATPALRFLAIVTSAHFVVGGCEDETSVLPAGPTTVTEGIYIYVDTDYSGASGHVTTDLTDLKKSQLGMGWWDDCISSVRVAPGWSATIYVETNFRGDSQEFTADVPNLGAIVGPCKGNWNDCITSIRLRRQ
jgi:hypothetical protein